MQKKKEYVFRFFLGRMSQMFSSTGRFLTFSHYLPMMIFIIEYNMPPIYCTCEKGNSIDSCSSIRTSLAGLIGGLFVVVEGPNLACWPVERRLFAAVAAADVVVVDVAAAAAAAAAAVEPAAVVGPRAVAAEPVVFVVVVVVVVAAAAAEPAAEPADVVYTVEDFG